MHDKNGNELKVGDTVMVPMTITSISPGEEYCNCTLETVYGRRPDGAKERMSAVNTGVVVLLDKVSAENL